jgi:hypothetical protein
MNPFGSAFSNSIANTAFIGAGPGLIGDFNGQPFATQQFWAGGAQQNPAGNPFLLTPSLPSLNRDKRPADADPLGVVTWYLERAAASSARNNVLSVGGVSAWLDVSAGWGSVGSNGESGFGLSPDHNCIVRTPLAHFELHQFDLIPFRTRSTPANRPRFSVVSLSMVQCAQRSQQLNAVQGAASGAFDADKELRLTIVQHVVKEMIRLRKWHALLVYRLGAELSPSMDPIYEDALPKELNKLQPNIRPIVPEPRHKSIQILIESNLTNHQPQPTPHQPTFRS